MRRLLSILLILFLVCSAAPAEDFTLGVVPEPSAITPAYRSEYTPEGHENCYWCTPMSLEDEEAVWGMLTAPITVVDIDMNKQAVIYAQPDESSEGIGVVTGQSQALHVLEQYDNGWSLWRPTPPAFTTAK